MRKTFYISILVLIFSGIANAQISGQLFRDGTEYPGAKIYILNGTEKSTADFDGNFYLKLPKSEKTFDLVINLNQGFDPSDFKELEVIIKNIKVTDSTKIDLGKIRLPVYKSISIEEFNELDVMDKKQCLPIKHYANLLGYDYTNNLSDDYILLNCSGENKITDFEFDEVEKTVCVEWLTLNSCE
ncbi:hypothetical protein QSV08_03135 [Maribacter sp. BPC-D8]|uniref:hypothetical protein n=1 Tax=Maribacter sp. BPC-D8 TaxID=3053613 RepID=UPI002B481EA3|nr:hypothetical protein [Maribacter sp. BPC-D8]WRI30238.1 hypothetical protein QSV08_03135 [Maribacter sp. BPC-D8]